MSNILSPYHAQSEIIEARRKSAVLRNQRYSYIFTIARTFLLFAFFFILFQTKFAFKIVDNNGMYPALSAGDLTLCYNQDQYIKNDVVFYRHDGKEYVGRVVAKGGDFVDYSESGSLIVNGTPQESGIVYPTYKPDGWAGAFRVPDGCVYVLGDYRVQTEDSRIFGAISLSDVEYKIIVLIRHSRV